MASVSELTNVIDGAFQRLLEQKKLGTENKERREEIFMATLKPFLIDRSNDDLEKLVLQPTISVFYESEPDEWSGMDPIRLKTLHSMISHHAKPVYRSASPDSRMVLRQACVIRSNSSGYIETGER